MRILNGHFDRPWRDYLIDERERIDPQNECMDDNIDNGIYRTGFAKSAYQSCDEFVRCAFSTKTAVSNGHTDDRTKRVFAALFCFDAVILVATCATGVIKTHYRLSYLMMRDGSDPMMIGLSKTVNLARIVSMRPLLDIDEPTIGVVLTR